MGGWLLRSDKPIKISADTARRGRHLLRVSNLIKGTVKKDDSRLLSEMADDVAGHCISPSGKLVTVIKVIKHRRLRLPRDRSASIAFF